MEHRCRLKYGYSYNLETRPLQSPVLREDPILNWSHFSSRPRRGRLLRRG